MTKKFVVAIQTVAFLLAPLAFAQNSPDGDVFNLPDEIEMIQGIDYVLTSNGALKLDLYRPKVFRGKLPTIVFVHGGGWKNGDKKSARKIASWLVPEGYAVASINYRLTDVAQWPAQINDCYSAVRWVRENAEEYGMDGKRVFAWGTSAGAHLAALMGTRIYPSEETISSRVQGVIDWYGPADLLTMPPNTVTTSRTFDQVAQSNGAKLLGAAIVNVPAIAKDASALYQVTPDDAPMLILHGDKDPGVPLDQSQRLADRLKQVGVTVKLHVVKGAAHGGKEFQTKEARDIVRNFLKAVQ